MEVLGARDEVPKERCMEVYKEEKIKIKRCIYQSKKKVNKQFGRNLVELESCFGRWWVR